MDRDDMTHEHLDGVFETPIASSYDLFKAGYMILVNLTGSPLLL